MSFLSVNKVGLYCKIIILASDSFRLHLVIRPREIQHLMAEEIGFGAPHDFPAGTVRKDVHTALPKHNSVYSSQLPMSSIYVSIDLDAAGQQNLGSFIGLDSHCLVVVSGMPSINSYLDLAFAELLKYRHIVPDPPFGQIWALNDHPFLGS